MLAPLDGPNATGLPGTVIYKEVNHVGRQPFLYNQGIVLIGQGSKRVYLGDTVYAYDPETYLVVSVPLPAECEIHASKDEPLLALIVDIDIGMLNRIISHMDEHVDHAMLKRGEKHRGLYVAAVTPMIKDVVLRLLTALQSPIESGVLGKGLVYELLFRIMCGENAGALYALAMKNTNLAKIEKALKLIHSSYNAAMNVDSLAALVNMSPSAFHRAFNDVTASSPIQYIKKIRLSKARDLLLEQRVRVSEVASQVGYESAAQFSREFKRYFGNSPSECRNNVSGR
ncbi:MAG: AraC family transcriptional regulator [Desulfobacteraceae bacterium]|nr:AraC family transcriptional regulator [Desulfobacteraceae bacterium]